MSTAGNLFHTTFISSHNSQIVCKVVKLFSSIRLFFHNPHYITFKQYHSTFTTYTKGPAHILETTIMVVITTIRPIRPLTISVFLPFRDSWFTYTIFFCQVSIIIVIYINTVYKYRSMIVLAVLIRTPHSSDSDSLDSLTLGACASEGYSSWVCVSVCVSVRGK